MGPFVSVPRFAVAWTDVQDVLLVIAAGGALFNSWRIARLSGRVDALESTMRTVQTLAAVQNGEELEIRKRNVPLARVVPIPARRRDRTVLGSGRGAAIVRKGLTDPLIPLDDRER